MAETAEFYLKNRIQYELVHDIDSQPCLCIDVGNQTGENQVILDRVGIKIHDHGIIIVPGTYISDCEEDVASIVYPDNTKDFTTDYLAWYRANEVESVSKYLSLTPTDAGNLLCSLVSADPASPDIPTIDKTLWS